MTKELEKEETKEESWKRYGAAKLRMRPDSLKLLVEALEAKNGFFMAGSPRVTLIDGGIYIEMMTNVGTHGNIVAFPIEFMIDVPAALMPKPVPEVKNEPVKEEPKPVGILVTLPTEPDSIALHDAGTSEGNAGNSGSVVQATTNITEVQASVIEPQPSVQSVSLGTN